MSTCLVRCLRTVKNRFRMGATGAISAIKSGSHGDGVLRREMRVIKRLFFSVPAFRRRFGRRATDRLSLPVPPRSYSVCVFFV